MQWLKSLFEFLVSKISDKLEHITSLMFEANKLF